MLIAAVVLVGAGLFVLVAGVATTRARLAADGAPALGVADGEVAAPRPGLVFRLAAPLSDAAVRLGRRLSPSGRVDLIRRRITYAGLEATWTPERVFGYKTGLALAGMVFGLLAHAVAGRGSSMLVHVHLPWEIWSLFWGVLLFFVPDFVLDSKARSRQRQIGRDLPEALDLLAITVEAGLGLEQALQTVSENMPGPLADEVTRLLREVELGVTRHEALSALRERTDVPELSAFVVALIQADSLGVGIADVLRVQAQQVRLRRRQRAREQAAKTPVKILFPVIFGVMPALFVVILGPAVLTIAHHLVGHH